MNQSKVDNNWEHRFIGRDDELALLVDAWQKAKSGEPQLVTLLADSGFGKTRIVQAFYNWLSQNEDGVEPDGYWPDRLDTDGKELKLTPEITDYQNSNEIPWLWWALRWTDSKRNRVPISLNSYLDELLIHIQPIIQWRKTRKLQNRALKSLGSVICSFVPLGNLPSAVTEIVEAIGIWKQQW